MVDQHGTSSNISPAYHLTLPLSSLTMLSLPNTIGRPHSVQAVSWGVQASFLLILLPEYSKRRGSACSPRTSHARNRAHAHACLLFIELACSPCFNSATITSRVRDWRLSQGGTSY